ncbi:small GTP-binding protein [Tritrichomonas foetus]|uniref:Small GTP-binding protein n=1 Tax=Tritrichomonas foetus TaxID=1144522 RepID=A0A1J4KVD4_9EUKA|nr:small GTP-binding protein [Tritrichomonas foetus]|eukprot:OHT14856.1 small GTP-binding protein [Tritrichomonas foetus]
MSHDANPRLSFKAVILGDSGVGKTSLVTRWTTGSYQSNTNPTVGANHQRKRVILEDQEVDLFLWDTAGQEQFQALTPLYSRSSSVAIMTCSITDSASFASIDKWFELLNSSTEEIPPVVLAVNKIDIQNENSPTEDKIVSEYGERFAGVFFVSAVTNEGVDNLFNFAAEQGYKFTVTNTNKPSLPLTAEKGTKSCC